MGTKNTPAKYDCYAKALPDEPMFILLARDLCAPATVEEWANARECLISCGMKPESDRTMITEAQQCAEAMREWRKNNDGVWKRSALLPTLRRKKG